jgi:hypothetical protein
MKASAKERKALAQALGLSGTIEQALCRESFVDYLRRAWSIIEPDTPYLHNWYIDTMAEYLVACTTGRITRLVINIPPRYMKSIAASIMWPTWVWSGHTRLSKIRGSPRCGTLACGTEGEQSKAKRCNDVFNFPRRQSRW